MIFSQWAKALGATVIGTVGSDEKMEVAKAHGCAHVINSSHRGCGRAGEGMTGGKGVPVVYDGVGQATFMTSLDCLKPRGLLVSFGNASGPVKTFDLGLLAAKGSLYVTRPTLMTYTATDEELARDRGRSDRDGEVRQGEDPGQPALHAGRRGRGASRSRGEAHDGDDGYYSVSEN